MEYNESMAEMRVPRFIGHMLPGILFITISTYGSVDLYRQHFKSNSKKKCFQASHGHPYWFLSDKTAKTRQIEAVVRFTLLFLGVAAELLSGFKGHNRKYTNGVIHAEHSAIFTAFGLSAFVDILTYHGNSCLPDGSAYFCGLGAFGVQFVLLAFHLHGRTLLNTHLHTLLIYTVGLNAVATITEYIYRDKFIWSLPRQFFYCLQGTWLIQTAMILFNPPGQRPLWMKMTASQ
ncbi:TMEM45A [Bugula neritina]|uniref:TMEM45A n=1 Tax=Bugula neritina TaxID=10212 RepID=A0A7J7JP52_BUGNE|nr:TMEM45A [Bugula neritina]